MQRKSVFLYFVEEHNPLLRVLFLGFFPCAGAHSHVQQMVSETTSECAAMQPFSVPVAFQSPFSISLLHHGGPVPEPGPGGEQLGPGRAQHGARDRRNPRKPHHLAFLCVRRLPEVSGVSACAQQLLQEAEGSGLHRVPQTARSHLRQVFDFYLDATRTYGSVSPPSRRVITQVISASISCLQLRPIRGAAGKVS